MKPMISKRLSSGGRGEEHSGIRLIIRHCGNAHPHICKYYVEQHGFMDICRLPRDSGLKPKLAHFQDLVVDLLFALKNLSRLRKAEEILTMGPMACNIGLLLKLGLLPRCRSVYWFGLFVHNPRWLRRLRPAFRILDSTKMHYVLFSEFEIKLYSTSLQLANSKLAYVPYGDLSGGAIGIDQIVEVPEISGRKEFYFSGGYSNRDYLSLIEIFKSIPHRLIIACAALNKEVQESKLPPNVTVVRDVSSEVFDSYVRDAKACIIPIAHNTGAAGQSCLLRYMKNRKIIIATDTGIIREYITNGISGVLVKNNEDAMSAAIRNVDANVHDYQCMAGAAYNRYINVFSGAAIRRKLDELVNQNVRGHLRCGETLASC
jgi:glycosyltransferase involved in cell wall biosynthesis